MRARLKDPHSLQDRAALMQSELTFGLLEGVMEVEIPKTVLLRVDSSSGTQVLTSENLPALLEAWRNRIAQLGDEEPCLQWFIRVRAALSRARSLLMLETTKTQFGCLQRPGLQVRELADILLQIRAVVEAVTISSRTVPHELKLRENSTAKFSISDVSRFLRWRATSNASDETLAISGLLKNLNAFELANLPPDERMETFLIRIQILPRDTIMPPGAKLNKPELHVQDILEDELFNVINLCNEILNELKQFMSNLCTLRKHVHRIHLQTDQIPETIMYDASVPSNIAPLLGVK